MLFESAFVPAEPGLINANVSVVELKFPLPVQRLPLLTLKLRLRIFGARDVLRADNEGE